MQAGKMMKTQMGPMLEAVVFNQRKLTLGEAYSGKQL